VDAAGGWNVWPVVVRELREQARARATLLLRLLAAGLAMAGLWLAGAGGLLAPGLGLQAFLALNVGAALALALICPALTADAVSRERREGTLALLWLCPVRPRDLLAGKLAAEALRAFTLWLAAAPVLLLPLLQGGVGARELALLLLVQAGVAGTGLTGGLLASTWSRRAENSLVSAYVIAGCTLGLAATGVSFLAGVTMALAAAARTPPWARALFWPAVFALLLALPAAMMALHLRAARDAVLIFWFRPISADEFRPAPPPVAATQAGAKGTLAWPAKWAQRGRARARRWLASRPLRALAARQPWWEFVPWLMALVLLGGWTLFSGSGLPGLAAFFSFLLGWAIILGGAWALRGPPWSGLLEALLTTPVPARELLATHAWAQRRAFALPVAVLVFAAACDAVIQESGRFFAPAPLLAALWWAAPLTGCAASLRCRRIVTAMALNAALLFGLPAVLGVLAGPWLNRVVSDAVGEEWKGWMSLALLPSLVQALLVLALGVVAGRLSRRWLDRREHLEHLLRQ
jgi:ABC-type transport system involved in multi-copper enzyme maturation permease subunit